MMIFGGLGFFLRKIRGTLPQDLFSIASQIALFAGSELCNRNGIPPGADWMNKRELEELFDSRQFSLGWWEIRDAGGIKTMTCQEEDRPEQGNEESNTGREDGGQEEEQERLPLRFGIDIGAPKFKGYATKGKAKAE
ncbi:hypothetical protein F5Y04DRAFT_79657 [Hypomontagnella monticulosa]|nr:hypothetical protein F5Y04DRAFT_79657 [Hypomontagnella monticulosa]